MGKQKHPKLRTDVLPPPHCHPQRNIEQLRDQRNGDTVMFILDESPRNSVQEGFCRRMCPQSL